MAQLGSHYKNSAASGLIKSGTGTVAGVIVNSHSSGTLKLWDSTTASGLVIIDTFTFPTGSGVYKFPDDIAFTNGLFATIGGTLNFTIIYN